MDYTQELIDQLRDENDYLRRQVEYLHDQMEELVNNLLQRDKALVFVEHTGEPGEVIQY